MLVTLTLIVGILTTASQPPVPSGRESNTKAQEKTREGDNTATPDQRGTENAPVLVRVLPSPKDPLQTAQEQEDRQNETIDRYATITLGALTILIGVGQILMIRKQANIAAAQNAIIDTQTSIMQLQERAASSSAIAAKAQTEHMLAGLAETRRAAEAAITSANALKVINRQWVRVESWSFEAWSVTTVGLHARVAIEVTNKTPLPLTIFAIRCYINGRRGTHSVADEYLVPDAITHQSVSVLMNDRELTDYRASRLRLVVTGWVHYWDAFGDLHNEIIAACLEHIGPGVDKPSVRGVSGVMRKMPRKLKEWPIKEMLDWMEKHDQEKDAKNEW